MAMRKFARARGPATASVPEAARARELALDYATIAVVANYAAGRGDSAHGVSMSKIEAVLGEAMGKVRRIIEKLVVAS